MKLILHKIKVIVFIIILTLGIIIKPTSVKAYSIPSESEFISKISSLQSRFKNGEYWNKYSCSDYSRTGNVPCPGYGLTTGMKCTQRGYCGDAKGTGCSCDCGEFDRAWQCMGFAFKMGYECFGISPRSWEKSYSLGTVYAGDVIRINGDGHSIFVYKVDGSTIYYADCNATGPCRVRWGATISYSELSKKFTYKHHLAGNTLKRY